MSIYVIPAATLLVVVTLVGVMAVKSMECRVPVPAPAVMVVGGVGMSLVSWGSFGGGPFVVGILLSRGTA